MLQCLTVLYTSSCVSHSVRFATRSLYIPFRTAGTAQHAAALARIVATDAHDSGVGTAAIYVPASLTPPAPLHNIYALSSSDLESLVVSWGQPKYRAKQIRDWVYTRGVDDFESCGNLPLALRRRLGAEVSLGTLAVEHEQLSRDGTRKRLWRLPDQQLIESVLMPYDTKRRTACISSQVGCAMGCTFCATGQMGFKRQLTADEIFEQAARFAAELRAREERLSNVVFMGMGEPFRNYEAVMEAAKRIMHTLGIGARHITISTVGVAPQIRRFADQCAEEKLEIKLAISLHAATDAKRSAIMPVNRKHQLAELLEACKYYVRRSGRRVTFEWALIAGENDGIEEARRLASLLRGLHAHVNLIPLNPTRGYGGQPSDTLAADRFAEELNRRGLPATIRVRRGLDIDAGCGQLADSVSKEMQERKRQAESQPV